MNELRSMKLAGVIKITKRTVFVLLIGFFIFACGNKEASETQNKSETVTDTVQTAMNERDPETAGTFIKSGIDVNIENDNDETALNLLSEEERNNIAEKRLNAKEDPSMQNYDFLTAVKAGDVNKIKEFIDSGAEVNAIEYINHDGWMNVENLLFAAVKTENSDIVKMLLDAGADVNTVTEFLSGFGAVTSTALIEAVRNGNEKIVKALLERGADVNLMGMDFDRPIATEGGDCENVTPLALAAR